MNDSEAIFLDRNVMNKKSMIRNENGTRRLLSISFTTEFIESNTNIMGANVMKRRYLGAMTQPNKP